MSSRHPAPGRRPALAVFGSGRARARGTFTVAGALRWAYGAKRSRVRDAVLEAARASPFTLPETETRKSQVWLVGFGESGLAFELLVWPTREAVKRPAAPRAIRPTGRGRPKPAASGR